MDIDYLEDCGLIRIYGGDVAQAAALHRAFEQLAEGVAKEVVIHELPGFESVNGCLLTAKAGSKDAGVRMIGANWPRAPATTSTNRFEWVLTPETWDAVAGLSEPFCESCSGYQWLTHTYGGYGDFDVLLSCDGQW